MSKINIHLPESDFMVIAGLLPNVGKTLRDWKLLCIINIEKRNNSSDEHHFFLPENGL